MTIKTNIFDVLMYLFDNYFENDFEISADQDAIKKEMIQVGFSEKQIERAFEWLEVLASQKHVVDFSGIDGKSTQRIFNEKEMEKLNTDSRGFIMYLEQTGVLDDSTRELVIDRAMALEIDEIDLHQLKWVVLMVLLNQPGREESFSWMESLVMDEMEAGLH